jgi:hypothetical protein
MKDFKNKDRRVIENIKIFEKAWSFSFNSCTSKDGRILFM